MTLDVPFKENEAYAKNFARDLTGKMVIWHETNQWIDMEIPRGNHESIYFFQFLNKFRRMSSVFWFGTHDVSLFLLSFLDGSPLSSPVQACKDYIYVHRRWWNLGHKKLATPREMGLYGMPNISMLGICFSKGDFGVPLYWLSIGRGPRKGHNSHHDYHPEEPEFLDDFGSFYEGPQGESVLYSDLMG